ncbi:hypothetical protein HL667_33445 [Bradyrhizobium sp. 83012]|uniref:Sulfur globule protein n=1 Tax=Bradyrhizobium aeschynomenes TaxID=2734909 RepID=A0ABX2CRH5_9BRAD|nr:hypothetical protein [Bradyrhizobium aeschynomenes]NPU10283.1 hypothetical protein [Bradyrhizobium aeschynomenes]NPU69937.1 hypothetical protein [Bradyrhizobium aeschynomenes]NPV19597.1 hypothetical protein [Bradyrhizobium aeschynomenes]
MREKMMGLLVGGAVALMVLPGSALARGPGGFHGGGFHHGGFHHGFGPGFALGFGFGYPGYYGGYPYYYPYTYEDLGGCYVVKKRVRTAHGWRLRPIEVCE